MNCQEPIKSHPYILLHKMNMVGTWDMYLDDRYTRHLKKNRMLFIEFPKTAH